MIYELFKQLVRFVIGRSNDPKSIGDDMETSRTEWQSPGDVQVFLPRGGGGTGGRDWGRPGGRGLSKGCRVEGGVGGQWTSIYREDGDTAF